MRSQNGFTLLELVVVMAIFAVLSLMAYGGLDSVLDTRRVVEAAMQQTGAAQKAYLRLRNDLQMVIGRDVRSGLAPSDAAVLTTSDGRLEITRAGWNNPLLQARATLERVSYRVDDERRLLRGSWRVLDRPQGALPVETVLLEQVEELRWRFLEPAPQGQGGGLQQLDWQTSWPPLGLTPAPGAAAPLPRAIELTVRTKAWGELRFLFRVNAAT